MYDAHHALKQPTQNQAEQDPRRENNQVRQEQKQDRQQEKEEKNRGDNKH